jgi:predicted esterase
VSCPVINFDLSKALKTNLVFILLFCGWFMPTGVIALDQPAGTPFEIKLTLNQLLGEAEASRYKDILSPDKSITWDVYLPDNTSSEPPGVFVYVSPRNLGKIETSWRAVMDQYNLIWIGANNSGNRMPVNRRMLYAIMALKALDRDYVIDSKRITVSGFSGGGRVASSLASQFPEVFTGAIYICGVDFWSEKLEVRIDRLVQNRFVFLTGSRDFNLVETKGVFHRYLNAGALHSELMVIPGMAHELPDAANLSEALDFIYD